MVVGLHGGYGDICAMWTVEVAGQFVEVVWRLCGDCVEVGESQPGTRIPEVVYMTARHCYCQISKSAASKGWQWWWRWRLSKGNIGCMVQLPVIGDVLESAFRYTDSKSVLGVTKRRL